MFGGKGPEHDEKMDTIDFKVFWENEGSKRSKSNKRVSTRWNIKEKIGQMTDLSEKLD